MRRWDNILCRHTMMLSLLTPTTRDDKVNTMTTNTPDTAKILDRISEMEEKYAILDPSILSAGGYTTFSESDRVLGRNPNAISIIKTLEKGGRTDISAFPSEYINFLNSASTTSFTELKYMPIETRKKFGKAEALSAAIAEWYYVDNAKLLPKMG